MLFKRVLFLSVFFRCVAINIRHYQLWFFPVGITIAIQIQKFPVNTSLPHLSLLCWHIHLAGGCLRLDDPAATHGLVGVDQ
jgi:hypothetical protein